MQASYPVKAKGTATPVPPRTNSTRPGINHYCGCPYGDGQCSIFGQHCCCYESGNISCQQAPVTSQKECCKPCKTGEPDDFKKQPDFMYA